MQLGGLGSGIERLIEGTYGRQSADVGARAPEGADAQQPRSSEAALLSGGLSGRFRAQAYLQGMQMGVRNSMQQLWRMEQTIAGEQGLLHNLQRLQQSLRGTQQALEQPDGSGAPLRDLERLTRSLLQQIDTSAESPDLETLWRAGRQARPDLAMGFRSHPQPDYEKLRQSLESLHRLAQQQREQIEATLPQKRDVQARSSLGIEMPLENIEQARGLIADTQKRMNSADVRGPSRPDQLLALLHPGSAPIS